MQFSQQQENYNEEGQITHHLQQLNQKTQLCKFIQHLNRETHEENAKLLSGYPATEPEEEALDQFRQTFSCGVMLKRIYSVDANYDRIEQFEVVNTSKSEKTGKENTRKRLCMQKKLSEVCPLNGEGFTKLKDGKVVFGKWFNGALVSHAKIVYPSGHIYIGEVKDYIRHGKGALMLKNGEKYVGDFCDGKCDGFGTKYNALGQIKHQGIWKQGILIKAFY